MLKYLIDKFLYRGYKAADLASTARVVARYARGNTSVQLGRYLNSDKADKLRQLGDKAAKRLSDRVDRATR